ncbi:MAG: hypothetical protein ABIK62_05345, partial [candidate division WOR-3 bacterium]
MMHEIWGAARFLLLLVVGCQASARPERLIVKTELTERNHVKVTLSRPAGSDGPVLLRSTSSLAEADQDSLAYPITVISLEAGTRSYVDSLVADNVTYYYRC